MLPMFSWRFKKLGIFQFARCALSTSMAILPVLSVWAFMAAPCISRLRMTSGDLSPDSSLSPEIPDPLLSSSTPESNPIPRKDASINGVKPSGPRTSTSFESSSSPVGGVKAMMDGCGTLAASKCWGVHWRVSESALSMTASSCLSSWNFHKK